MKAGRRYQRLIDAAKRARKHAYCPYSRYPVGAAVLAGSGRIYTGVNVEVPSLIAHICAERNAIFSAFSRGERKILAVATASAGSTSCGACRQVILEFGVGDTPIYSVCQTPGGAERVIRTSIRRLMPFPHTGETFGFDKRQSS